MTVGLEGRGRQIASKGMSMRHLALPLIFWAIVLAREEMPSFPPLSHAKVRVLAPPWSYESAETGHVPHQLQH